MTYTLAMTHDQVIGLYLLAPVIVLGLGIYFLELIRQPWDTKIDMLVCTGIALAGTALMFCFLVGMILLIPEPDEAVKDRQPSLEHVWP